jgi:hypothetical protein
MKHYYFLLIVFVPFFYSFSSAAIPSEIPGSIIARIHRGDIEFCIAMINAIVKENSEDFILPVEENVNYKDFCQQFLFEVIASPGLRLEQREKFFGLLPPTFFSLILTPDLVDGSSALEADDWSLRRAILENESKRVIQALHAKHGTRKNVPGQILPIALAAFYGQEKVVETFLDVGTEVDPGVNHPLVKACERLCVGGSFRPVDPILFANTICMLLDRGCLPTMALPEHRKPSVLLNRSDLSDDLKKKLLNRLCEHRL